jgi:hypothetical protein
VSDLPVGVVLGAPVVCDMLRALPAGATVEEVAREAMRVAQADAACFMCKSDDEQFRVGVGGLLLFYRGNAGVTARIERELLLLRTLSASMSGVPVDLSQISDEDAPEPLGLVGMFRDARANR